METFAAAYLHCCLNHSRSTASLVHSAGTAPWLCTGRHRALLKSKKCVFKLKSLVAIRLHLACWVQTFGRNDIPTSEHSVCSHATVTQSHTCHRPHDLWQSEWSLLHSSTSVRFPVHCTVACSRWTAGSTPYHWRSAAKLCCGSLTFLVDKKNRNFSMSRRLAW